MTTPRSIQRTYLVLLFGNTLAASFIWGINTIFLLDAGLSNLEAFAANAFFTAGMVLFEVPTGVVADTVGRRASYLLGSLRGRSKSPSLLRRLVEAAHSGGAIDKEDGMSNAQQMFVPTGTWSELEAEKAFTRASRARRRAAVVARLRRARLGGLTVFDETRRSSSRSSRGGRESPLAPVQG